MVHRNVNSNTAVAKQNTSLGAQISILWLCLSLLFVLVPACAFAANKHAHESMSCSSCHQENENPAASMPSCKNCHNGMHGAPKPLHFGLTKLHIKRIACESCHIRNSVAHWQKDPEKPATGKIVPVDSAGMVLHHDVALADDALGAKGCGECHSDRSKFPAGSTREEKQFGMWREKILKPVSGWIFLAVFILSVCHYITFGPHRFKRIAGEPLILRFTLLERFFHWAAMGSFAFLAGSGILFMLHIETPRSHIRVIHGHVGVIFVLSLIGMIACWWKNARFVSYDIDWIRRVGGYLWMKGECKSGKFNAGQKLFFWAVGVVLGILISATGFMLAGEHGSAHSWVFTIHDLAAIALIAALIGHIYLSIFGNPGTILAIFSGKVRQSWAKRHHPHWFNKQK